MITLGNVAIPTFAQKFDARSRNININNLYLVNKMKLAFSRIILEEIYKNVSSSYSYEDGIQFENQRYFLYKLLNLHEVGSEQAIVLETSGSRCSNRSCKFYIFNLIKGEYKLLSTASTARSDNMIGILSSKSHNWQDLAVCYFNYETRTTDWYAMKFNGKKYIVDEQKKLNKSLIKVVVSDKSPSSKLKLEIDTD